MSRAEMISGRLPHFFRHWEPDSVISALIYASGKRLDESEKDLVSVMRAHWVDTASNGEIDRLGAIYNIKRNNGEPDPDYRNRLKTAIISYKGGGTISAIRNLVRIVLRLPPDFPVEIVENPEVRLSKTWKVSAGSEWVVNPRNIQDAEPEITIKVETRDARVKDPTLMNLSTGESVTFNGELAYGEELRLGRGNATINGKDVTGSLSSTDIPGLPRKRSKWRYMEFLGANIGTFDSSQFDKSVFTIDISSTVTFEWTAYQPAAFEVRLPHELLVKAGVTQDYMAALVNSVKACGVRGEVKVVRL